jgi:hypothetical protein
MPYDGVGLTAIIAWSLLMLAIGFVGGAALV